LKDPLVANDVFLKKPRRIEAMGLVLVVALLLWRLMERAMRQKNVALPGWNHRETTRPTGFMMASKFSSVFVGTRGERRFLLRPLDDSKRPVNPSSISEGWMRYLRPDVSGFR